MKHRERGCGANGSALSVTRAKAETAEEPAGLQKMAGKGADRVGLWAALGCLALVCGLVGVYLTRQTGWLTIANLSAASVFFVLAAAGALLRVRRPRGRPAWRARSAALLEIVVGLGVAGGLLWAASGLEVSWDLTRPRTFSLTPFTRQVLERLDVDVEALLVRPTDSPPGREKLLLDLYAAASSRFHVREVPPQVLDPEAQRVLRGRSQIILRSGERVQRVPLAEEVYVTQALLTVSARAEAEVCFLTGHGEADPRGKDPRGLGRLTATLEREGFGVSSLLLAAEPAVPESCRVVVLAAPERGLLETERLALDAYWKRGGRLLVFLEPGRVVEPTDLLESVGLGVPDATVVDERASLFGSQAPGRELLVNRFARHHPVAQGLQEQTRVVFSDVRPLEILTQDVSGFVFSEPVSRLEPASEPAPLRGERKGSFALGASVEKDWGRGSVARLVVFGDLDLAANRLFAVLYNRDLVMNAVYWLAGRDASAGVRPKVEDLYQAPLFPERAVAAYHSVVLLVPETIVALGILFWHRRRRL